jgi:hypothetical protein
MASTKIKLRQHELIIFVCFTAQLHIPMYLQATISQSVQNIHKNIFQHFKQVTDISIALHCFSNNKIALHIEKKQSTTSDKDRCIASCSLYYISCSHYLIRILKNKNKIKNLFKKWCTLNPLQPVMYFLQTISD